MLLILDCGYVEYAAISLEQSDNLYYQGYGAWDEQQIYEAGLQGPQQYATNGYHRPPGYDGMNGQHYGNEFAYAQGYGIDNGSPAYDGSGDVYGQVKSLAQLITATTRPCIV